MTLKLIYEYAISFMSVNKYQRLKYSWRNYCSGSNMFLLFGFRTEKNTYKQLNNINIKIPLTELSSDGAVSPPDCSAFGQCLYVYI